MADTEAMRSAKQAAKDAKKSGDTKLESQSQLSIATLLVGQGKMAEGVAKAQEALEQFKGLGDVEGQAESYTCIINAHLSVRGGSDEALAACADMAKLYEENRMISERGQALQMAAEVTLGKNDTPGAIKLLVEAQQCFKDKDETEYAVYNQIWIASLQEKQEMASEAQETLNAALSTCKKAKNKELEATVTNQIVQLNLKADRSSNVVRMAQTELETAQQSKDQNGVTNALHNLCQAHFQMGSSHDISAAASFAAQMLTAAKDSGNVAAEAAAFHHLATSKLMTNPYSDEGFAEAQESVNLYRSVENGVVDGVAAMQTYANCLFLWGHLEAGLSVAREALAIYRHLDDFASEERLKAIIDQSRISCARMREEAHGYNGSPYLSGVAKSVRPPAAEGGVGSTTSSSGRVMTGDEVDDATDRRKFWGVPKTLEMSNVPAAIKNMPRQVLMYGRPLLPDNSSAEVCCEMTALIAVMGKREVKFPIVLLTRGVFARPCGEMVGGCYNDSVSNAIWGLIRCAKTEINAVQFAMIDFSTLKSYAQLTKHMKPMAPEAAYYHGANFQPQMAQIPSLIKSQSAIPKQRPYVAVKNKDDKATTGKMGATKFNRKSFPWVVNQTREDYLYFRQEWKVAGACRFADPEGAETYPFNPVSPEDM